MPYDINRVTPWFKADFRLTLFIRGSSKLTIESKGKRIHIYLDQAQTEQLRKDTENAVNS